MDRVHYVSDWCEQCLNGFDMMDDRDRNLGARLYRALAINFRGFAIAQDELIDDVLSETTNDTLRARVAASKALVREADRLADECERQRQVLLEKGSVPEHEQNRLEKAMDKFQAKMLQP
jgi:hypothetical protein